MTNFGGGLSVMKSFSSAATPAPDGGHPGRVFACFYGSRVENASGRRTAACENAAAPARSGEGHGAPRTARLKTCFSGAQLRISHAICFFALKTNLNSGRIVLTS
jgi:hypothetical protein